MRLQSARALSPRIGPSPTEHLPSRRVSATTAGGHRVLCAGPRDVTSSSTEEPPASVVWFSSNRLQRLGLDPARCAVLRVQGESMEPPLPEGSSTLVDRNGTRRGDGEIFVVRMAEGLVVKRAVKGEDGGRQHVSDHPALEPVAFPARHMDDTVGELGISPMVRATLPSGQSENIFIVSAD